METMTMATTVNRERGLEWSVVSRALPGETVSGDEHVVAASDDGILLAVIDGLGHGSEATAAARKAVEVLSRQPGAPVIELIRRCHDALRSTRGAAMTVVAVNRRERTATALGIGNVETVVVRGDDRAQPARESVLLRNGVVGYQLPQLQTSVIPLGPGDVVVFATDGVREDFGDRINAAEPLPQMVNRILEQKFRGTDDALVLACKILERDEG
jgi:serine phosphatase RsbU (regulator of sigma subunit)